MAVKRKVTSILLNVHIVPPIQNGVETESLGPVAGEFTIRKVDPDSAATVGMLAGSAAETVVPRLALRCGSMNGIPVGTKGHVDLLVTSDVAIDFLGVEEARVLSTPSLIMHLEMAARNAIKPLLEDGWDSVGTAVNVKHLAATPIGMHIRFEAEVIEVNERRVTFRVEAHDEKEKVSEGTHERFLVNVARFAGRVQSKAAGGGRE